MKAGALSLLFVLAAGVCLGRSGADLQRLLDAGENVVLEPGEIVELTEPLNLRSEGQAIYTRAARTIADFGTLRHGKGSVGTLIEGYGIAGLQLRDLVLDANRSEFEQPEGVLESVPMISLGGEGGNDQVIRRCIVLNSRSAGGWGAIHVQEGGRNIVVEDNVVFASGADIRGNGRSHWEKPFGWGDGVSTASRDTLIRNNLIYDVTDEGIMVQGGPGSQVLNNVVVSVSREMLGGIALIDPFSYYKMDTDSGKRFDYRGVLVEGNSIVAMGGRIHVGVPLGGPAWTSFFDETVLVGATVRNNLISGGAAGYGYVANGIDGFIVSGNKSDATYSGKGDGPRRNPPDEPSAFLYDPSTVGDSVLQAEFLPAKNHVTKVLRSNRIPSDPMGYRDAGYPEPEARAIVETAYLEMLGRAPTAEESERWSGWLRSTRSNADTLRTFLMTLPAFAERFGAVNPLDIHKWRSERWLRLITESCAELQDEGVAEWPDAKAFHSRIVRKLSIEGVIDSTQQN